MRISAYSASFIRYFQLLFVPFSLGLLFFIFCAVPVHAQITTPLIQQPNSSLNQIYSPDVDADVPLNHHNYTQIVVTDVLSAIICQLSGIDPINPNQPCLDINPLSGKLGFANNTDNDKFGQINKTPQSGGVLGVMSAQLGILFNQSISSTQYLSYLSHNFGIIKPAYATQPPAQGQITNCNSIGNTTFGYGYCGLNPIFNIWKSVRDFAYALLVIAFVVLALGIMLRFKADPRTVMTLQNQIPRVIIAIILITFSYGIAGFMIDIMWTVTYMGINAITAGSKATAYSDCTGNNDDQPAKPIAQAATYHLLDTPLSYTNAIFNYKCGVGNGNGHLANQVGGAINYTLGTLIFSFVGLDYSKQTDGCSIWNISNPIDCITSFVSGFLGLIIKLIVLIALIVTLFRLWIELLKTAVLFLVYAIAGPIYIVFGLIPGRPLGFEKWLRLVFAHLAAFPVVAFLFVFAAVLAAAIPEHPDPNAIFIPPLIGNPSMDGFGLLLAFGLIMISPAIPPMIREKMKVPSGKLGSQIRGGLGAGAAVIAAGVGAPIKSNLRRYDPHTLRGAGPLRDWLVGNRMTKVVDKKDHHGNVVIGSDGNVQKERVLKTKYKLFERFAYGASPEKRPGSSGH